MESRFRRCKMEVERSTEEFSSKVVECLKRNGIEGRFLNNVENGKYDNKIRRLVLCNSEITPVEFVKQIISEELC